MADKVVIGISGSSGALLGLRLLSVLEGLSLECHVIISETAKKIIESEAGKTLEHIKKTGAIIYANDDFFASVASGSFHFRAMAVVPCSMKTLAGIACGYADNLLLRTADVCLKERRKLVLATRETPLNLIHIENMRRVTLAGAIVFPPVITLYSRPKSIEEMLDHIIGRILDAMGIENEIYRRWK